MLSSPELVRASTPLSDIGVCASEERPPSPRCGTPDQVGALFEMVHFLTEENRRLERSNQELSGSCQSLQEKLLKSKQKRLALKDANAQLADQIARLTKQIENANSQERLDEEDVEFAKELCDSFVLFQALPEPAPAPIPNFPPPVFDLKIVTDDYSPSLQTSSFTASILRQGTKLKPYFRDYVWKTEPTDLQKNAIGWSRTQIKLVKEAMNLLKEMEERVQMYKQTETFLSMPMRDILEDIKKVNYGEADDNWEDCDEEPQPTTSVGENPMLQSVLFSDKMRNVSDTGGLIERLTDLCREKRLQLGRTLNYLNSLLQERIESKQAAAFAYRLAIAEENRLQQEREEAKVAAAAKREKDRIESFAIARSLLQQSLPQVERGRVDFEFRQKGLTWESQNVRALASVCKETFVGIYLQKLKSHPDYAEKISQFHSELEDGFLTVS